MACFVCPGIELLSWRFRQDHKVCEEKRVVPLSEIASSCWAALRWLSGKKAGEKTYVEVITALLECTWCRNNETFIPYCKRRQTKALNYLPQRQCTVKPGKDTILTLFHFWWYLVLNSHPPYNERIYQGLFASRTITETITINITAIMVMSHN